MIDFGVLARTGTPLVIPGAHDALTARLIELAGFEVYGVGGAALAATQLALPDTGLQSFGEYRDAVGRIMEGSRLPVMIDGENGFGDAKAIVRTVRSFERLGASAVAFEDLVLPSRLGQPPVVEALPVIEGKLRAALDARRDESFKIIGRTDSAYAVNTEEAIARASSYAELGVDAIIVPGLPDLDAYKRLRDAVSVPILAVVVPGGPWYAPGIKELGTLGIEAVISPVSVLTRVMVAINEGLARLKELDASPAPGFDFRLMGEVFRAADWIAIDRQQP